MKKQLRDIITNDSLFLIAGPCAIENREDTLLIASTLKKICSNLDIPLIFKGSYRKANRTKLSSFQGIGDEKALHILAEVHESMDIPTITDIHTPAEADMAAKYVQILQIPAFLCRQTDLLLAAARTGKIVNIKKGQFMSADSMQHAMAKINSESSLPIILTERGNSFGYGDLVVDMTNIPAMKSYGAKVVMDCTHALQQPNQSTGVTGGRPKMIETIAKSAIAAGADGLFIETHPQPARAQSDGANMLPLQQIEPLLRKCLQIKKALQIG